jgi:hypothetical protein
MPFANWKDWATRRPEWAREDMGAAFERYVEQKWKDALNVAAAEPAAGRPVGAGRRGGKQKSQRLRNHQLIGRQEP